MRAKRNGSDDSGASSVEYGLILTAIAATIVAVVFAFGGSVVGMFDNSCRAIQGGASGPAADCQ